MCEPPCGHSLKTTEPLWGIELRWINLNHPIHLKHQTKKKLNEFILKSHSLFSWSYSSFDKQQLTICMATGSMSATSKTECSSRIRNKTEALQLRCNCDMKNSKARYHINLLVLSEILLMLCWIWKARTKCDCGYLLCDNSHVNLPRSQYWSCEWAVSKTTAMMTYLELILPSTTNQSLQWVNTSSSATLPLQSKTHDTYWRQHGSIIMQVPDKQCAQLISQQKLHEAGQQQRRAQISSQQTSRHVHVTMLRGTNIATEQSRATGAQSVSTSSTYLVEVKLLAWSSPLWLMGVK